MSLPKVSGAEYAALQAALAEDLAADPRGNNNNYREKVSMSHSGSFTGMPPVGGATTTAGGGGGGGAAAGGAPLRHSIAGGGGGGQFSQQQQLSPHPPGMDDGGSVYSRNSGSPRRLLDVKRSRRQAELDAQAIRNRVERLKLEEDKAARKIEETRKRAFEILQLKARNEEKQRQREEQRMLKEMELRRAIQQKAVMKAARNAALKSAKVQLIKTKRQDVMQQKMSKQLYVETIERSRESDKMRARNLKESIRERELGMLHRKHQVQQFAETRAQSAYESRLTEEERERERAERMIRQLEEEEEELIQRLRMQYEKQRSAYVELERALDV